MVIIFEMRKDCRELMHLLLPKPAFINSRLSVRYVSIASERGIEHHMKLVSKVMAIRGSTVFTLNMKCVSPGSIQGDPNSITKQPVGEKPISRVLRENSLVTVMKRYPKGDQRPFSSENVASRICRSYKMTKLEHRDTHTLLTVSMMETIRYVVALIHLGRRLSREILHGVAGTERAAGGTSRICWPPSKAANEHIPRSSTCCGRELEPMHQPHLSRSSHVS